MLPSHLRNAAAVILASATACFGAWTQPWPCTNNSFPMGYTGATASAFSEDLWRAWEERYRAISVETFPTSQAGVVSYWIGVQSNPVSSNVVITSTVPWITNTYTWTNVTQVITNIPFADTNLWPSNTFKYRVSTFRYPQITLGDWIESWSMAEVSAYSYTNGKMPEMSYDFFLSNYPPMIVNTVSTNLDGRDRYTWLIPEFETNGEVRVSQAQLYYGRYGTSWSNVFIPTNEGAISSNTVPMVNFWRPTGALGGTFTIYGQYLDATNYAWISSSSVISASATDQSLGWPATRITNVTESGASSGITMTVYYPTNAMRSRVPLCDDSVKKTVFNSEYHRVRAHKNVSVPCDVWVPTGGTYFERWRAYGAFEASNDTAAARANAYGSGFVNVYTSLQTDVEWRQPVFGAYTNQFIDSTGTKEQGDFGFCEGSTTVTYQTKNNQTPVYDIGSGSNTWQTMTLLSLVVSNEYETAATNGVLIGTNDHWWTGCTLEYSTYSRDAYVRAFQNKEAGDWQLDTNAWRSYGTLQKDVDFFYRISQSVSNWYSTSMPISDKVELRSKHHVDVSPDMFVKGAGTILDAPWMPAETEFSTTNGVGHSWTIADLYCIYQYGTNYTRP